MSIRRESKDVPNFAVGEPASMIDIPVGGASGVLIRVMTKAGGTFASTLTVSRRIGEGVPFAFAIPKTLTAAAPTLTIGAADLLGLSHLRITTNADGADANKLIDFTVVLEHAALPTYPVP